MKEQHKCRFLVAAPECAQSKFREILAAIAMEPDAFCTSGEETLEQAQGTHVLLLTTWKLSDMQGAELAEKLGEDADVLMIVPNDYEEAEEDDGIVTLQNPLSQDALYQALRTMMHAQKKMLAWKQKAKKLERVLEERKIVDKAKGKLIDQLHMTESQAHYHIQKKSMDTGRRIVDVAREILEAKTAEADG